MISNLTIKGFRAFRELRVDPLTRVNLFVGSNNAGKTSILEAAELVALGSASGLRRSLRRRGEEVLAENQGGRVNVELDPSHLFFGHSLAPGNSFLISDDSRQRWIRCEVGATQLHVREAETPEEDRAEDDFAPTVPALKVLSHRSPEPSFARLSPQGGLSSYSSLAEPNLSVSFLGTGTLSGDEIGLLWDRIVLTPEEEIVASALRIIEPQIERIAVLGESRRISRGVFVKLEGSEKRLHLGSIGDGLKRLLNLTLNLASAKGGFLFVDEIDTGLHFSVMADMWKLVIETAKRLDVQVLATTHSIDCVHALAWIQEKHTELAEEVKLHRIEKGAQSTVAYNVDEIAIAARALIEVR